MKHLRRWLPVSLAVLFVALPARSCGPDFPEAIFVLHTGPGGAYAAFAAGRLGVPQPAYRTRHLVIAYDYLTQHPLSTGEQQQAIAVNAGYLNPWQAFDPDKPLPGFDSWIKARTTFGAVDGFVPDSSLDTSRSAPGQDYGDFTNCLDDAFATATRSLATLIAAHTAKDPAVIDWVRAQDAVFTNCGDGKALTYFGPPDKKPAPPPQPHPPAAAPANAPLWLQQDRAYQLAAASFYALRFDDAIARLRAIAADTASPWSNTARYLVARAYIRKASLAPSPEPSRAPDHATAAQIAAIQAADKERQARSAASDRQTLLLAQHELLAMQSDPRMAPMRASVDSLLDYVNLRVAPDQQAQTLAARLHQPDSARFGQALIDLTWLRTNRADASLAVAANTPNPGSNDMLAWIDDLSTLDRAPNPWSGDPSIHTPADAARATADILQHWHDTHSTAWLVAALTVATPTSADTAALLHAAAAVPATDPAWTAVTYHRLRLSPPDAATRTEVLALLPQLTSTQTPSTVNLFLALAAATAPSLDAWLAAAARVPAGDTTYDAEESLPATVDASSDNKPAPVEDVCGKTYPANTVLPLFDADAAEVLNRDLPLRLLAQAAEGTTLPQNLRFQVAQAAWARAVLLDQPAIAQRMTPLLVGCRAAWKPVLAAYDSASTPAARHAAGLLALLRFASTEPSVRYGEERREGFATYDSFRQNWWCSAVPPAGQTVDFDPDTPAVDLAPLPPVPPPPFLTAADLAEAHTEVAALERIPRASTYFAQQALAWAQLHATDAQTPDILGEADRALRNSCRKDPPYDANYNQAKLDPADMTMTSNLAKALFDVLHRDYPNSSWAHRYKSWQ